MRREGDVVVEPAEEGVRAPDGGVGEGGEGVGPEELGGEADGDAEEAGVDDGGAGAAERAQHGVDDGLRALAEREDGPQEADGARRARAAGRGGDGDAVEEVRADDGAGREREDVDAVCARGRREGERKAREGGLGGAVELAVRGGEQRHRGGDEHEAAARALGAPARVKVRGERERLRHVQVEVARELCGRAAKLLERTRVAAPGTQHTQTHVQRGRALQHRAHARLCREVCAHHHARRLLSSSCVPCVQLCF